MENNFEKKELREVEDSNHEKKSAFNDESPLDESDDDLEIPAFIRKKMGK
jgi:hypothetical protein